MLHTQPPTSDTAVALARATRRLAIAPFHELQSRAWANVERLLRQDYVDADLVAVKIVCSCVAAHRITSHPPVWAMCVAPSGSLKTAILQSLDGQSS
jgi:hypothetical protein